MLIETFQSKYTNRSIQISSFCKPFHYYKFAKKSKYDSSKLFLQKKKYEPKINFLKTWMEIKEEIWLTKWPVFGRIIKRTIGVFIILTISIFFVYTVDGILGIANRLFFIKLNRLIL